MGGICIGMISYFPDNGYRSERIARCGALIEKCDELFGLPIIAIAQGWRGELTSGNLVIRAYPRLGITAARQELWKYFGESGFDWMICFDDDCVLEGTREDAQRLLGFLASQKSGYFCGKRNEFKLFAVHSAVVARQGIPDLDAIAGTGIEDLAYFELLRRRFPELALTFNTGTLKETSVWAGDEASTWHRRGIAELIGKTTAYIERELTK